MAVLTLAVAKTHLNITGTTYDAELTDVIAAAEAAIAKRCGPLEETAATERIQGCTSILALGRLPVVELTSVTPVGGSALTLADLYLDPVAATITYVHGGYFSARAYDVVYTSGRETCPADLLFAVKELVRHLWETQRGPSRRPGSTSSDAFANTLPGAAYTFPFRVEQLIAEHALSRLGGFA